MNNQSFYLTLPSNAGGEGNKTGHFTVTLPQTIDLKGDWEVCMSEIIYPYTWINFPDKPEGTEGYRTTRIHFGIDHSYVTAVDLPPAHYQKAEDLVAAINGAMAEKKVKIKVDGAKAKIVEDDAKENKNSSIEKKEVPKETVMLSDCLTFKYNPYSKKTKISLAHKCISWLHMSKQIAYMLGFAEQFKTSFKESHFAAEYMPDMTGGINVLYVYSDLVAPQLLGDSFSNLLRLIHVEGVHGSTVEKVFFNRQYLPVLQKRFSQIEIHIKADSNQYIEFDSGKVIITLHFQKKRRLFE